MRGEGSKLAARGLRIIRPRRVVIELEDFCSESGSDVGEVFIENGVETFDCGVFAEAHEKSFVLNSAEREQCLPKGAKDRGIEIGTSDVEVRRNGIGLEFGQAAAILISGKLELAARCDSGISISQISAEPDRPGVHRKNAVVVSMGGLAGVLDRSPCGTGTCAKMATLHARGKLGLHEDFVHEGILGTTFTGRIRITSAANWQKAPER